MITGLLEERPLPVVLQQLYSLRFTGELALNTRAGLIQVYLREGYPVYVNLSESNELLGRILVEMRVLTEASMRRALATPPEPGQRYGDVLLQFGLCDENQLKQALRAQVRRKLHRLFAVADGGYVAIPGDHQKGLQGGESMRVHPFRVIIHGVRSFSAERLKGLLRPLWTQNMRLQLQTSSDVVGRFAFAAEETYVIELLRRGFFGLPDLVEVAGQDPALTLCVVYTLWITELLELGPEGSQPQAREHITDLPPPPPVAPRLEQVVEVPPPRPAAIEAPKLIREQPTAPAKEISKPLSPRASAKSPGIKLELERDLHAQPGANEEPKAATARTTKEAMLAAARSTREPPTVSKEAPAPGKPPSGQRPVSFEEMALLRADVEKKAKVVDDETLFAVLGVGETADAAEIKAAYLQAAKKFHPDRVVAMGLQALKEQAEKVFRRVNEANHVLSDPEKREEYLAEQRAMANSGDKLTKEKELAVKAVNAELAFSRGSVFLRKRDYSGAAREFDEALRLNPDEGEHVGYAAWARFCAGKLPVSDATKELVKAIRLSPKCGRLHYFLAVLYKQDGVDDKAYQSFRKAFEIDSRIEEAQSEIRLIDARRKTGAKSPSGDSGRGKSSDSHRGDGKPEKKLGLFERLRQAPKK